MVEKTEKRLKKFYMEFSIGEDFFMYEHAAGQGKLQKVILPLKLDVNPLENLKMLLLENNETVSCFDNKEDLNKFKEECPPGYFNSVDVKFPKIVYSDITEKNLLGYSAISADSLCSDKSAVWTGCGYRVFEISCELDYEKDNDDKVSLYWFRIDDKDIVPLYVKKVMYDDNKKKFYAYIDTNEFGDALKNNEREVVTFSGRFELFKSKDEGNQTYSFPIRIRVRNTARSTPSANIVSIDFGTSATCVAIEDDGKRLINLSGLDKCEEGDNAYENPTNLMVYDWDELYNQWKVSNGNFPYFKVCSEEKEKTAQYDSGYSVTRAKKETKKGVNGQRKVNAIISHLKMIPWQKDKGDNLYFIPYDSKERKPVWVVDSDVKDTDEKHLNPIALYGYILGRAINDPSKGKIYTDYYLTYPEKFKKELREKLQKSLEYGIKRSLPVPMRNKFDGVKCEFSEPVACVGTIMDNYGEQLWDFADDEKGKLFALYDLGGGTMDYLVGLCREADKNRREEEGYEYTVEILSLGGEEGVGGEYLIHQLAYMLYRDSKDEMNKKHIPFVLPYKEKEAEGFGELISKDKTILGDFNVNLLVENVARPLFKASKDDMSKKDMIKKITGLEETQGENGYKIPLFGDESLKSGEERRISDSKKKENNSEGQKDENEVEITIVPDNVSKFIEKQIQQSVSQFHSSCADIVKKKQNYLNKYYGIHCSKWEQEIVVFLSGNASRQYFVEETMKNMFKDNKNIIRIGTGISKESNGFEKEKKYLVTEKTAVAFGQLDLKGAQYYLARPQQPPIQFSVGYKDVKGIKTLFSSGHLVEDNMNWKFAGICGTGESPVLKLYYGAGDLELGSESNRPWNISVPKQCLAGGNVAAYIRFVASDKIELYFGTRGESPKNPKQVFEITVSEQNPVVKAKGGR